MLSLEWRVAAVTDTGCKRSENQDNFWVSPDNRVFVVADGMGGERGGATASRLAVEAVETLWNREKPDGDDREKVLQWLVEAVSNANSSVWETSARDPAVHGMGTTIVMAVQSDDGHLYIAHVGDSRAYMVREDKTIVLTQDHSVVMELLLQGKISPEQFRTSPFRNYITRCVGHNNNVEIDQTPVEVKPGDCIILCTDGLPTVLHDDEIGEICRQNDSAEEVCKQLLDETLLGGAPDNVTIIAIRYSQVPSERLEEQLTR
jgi:protein phosphatase